MSKFGLTFILIYLIGCFAAIFIDGSIGIFLYQIEYFINPPIRWWYSGLPELRYSYIISVCILIGYLIKHKKYSTNHLLKVPPAKWWLAMVILIVSISPIAVWPQMHQLTVKAMLKLSLFAFLTYKMIDTPQKFERMIWSYLTGMFYIAWLGRTSGRNQYGRLENIGGPDCKDANDLGAVFVSSIPLLLFYLVEGKYWQKIISAIFLAYIMNGMILVNSRGAFLGLIISSIYLLYSVFFNKIKSTKTKIRMVLVFIVGIGLFLYLTDATFWQRMNTLREVQVTEEGYLEGGGASRTYLWTKGLEVAKKYPFGVGTWGFQFLSSQYLPEKMLTGGIRALHSTYFQALVEIGYLGFVIFMGFLISNFNLLRKARKYFLEKENVRLFYQSIAIGAGFIAFLTASIFIDRLYAELLYWFVIFIACFTNIYLIKGHSFSIVKGDE